MSLDEAYIVLGIEGGAKHDDEAIRVGYNELVVSYLNYSDVGCSST
jgi:hypothetical protein